MSITSPCSRGTIKGSSVRWLSFIVRKFLSLSNINVCLANPSLSLQDHLQVIFCHHFSRLRCSQHCLLQIGLLVDASAVGLDQAVAQCKTHEMCDVV